MLISHFCIVGHTVDFNSISLSRIEITDTVNLLYAGSKAKIELLHTSFFNETTIFTGSV